MSRRLGPWFTVKVPRTFGTFRACVGARLALSNSTELAGMTWSIAMSTWQITQALVLLCGALSISACDDVLEGKEHRDHDSEEDPGCCSSGGGSSHGGGRTPNDEDGQEDGDEGDDGVETGKPDAGADEGDSSGREAPVVDIESGELIGRYENSKVRSFRGIPYAKPPVEALRFLAPQEPESWSKARKATEFAPSCIQSGKSAGASGQDEDCLYLNVWAPVRMAKQKLPVFVWFHGGDHASGSASEALPKRALRYDGTSLAEQGVIVVSVNYRLGPLGFLAHKQLAKEKGGKLANVGLWDQQQALRWVNANALSFGGDKNNVTIAGQGSGASDVCLHAVAKESHGLFAHVVQQSGGCTTYQPSAAQLQGRAQPWLDQLSCEDAELLSCLQDKTIKELYSAADDAAFVPCVDDDFISDQPRHLFDRAEIADVSFLLGSNADEGSVYIDQFPEVETEDDYHSVIQKLFPEIGLKELCEAYPHEQFADADHPYQKSLAYVLGDGHVVCSTLDTAIRAREAGASVYLYNFEGQGDAAHGAEIPYVFGTLSSASAAESALSTQIQSYWTNYARTGDPDDGSEPTWPAFTTSKPWRINLSSELSVLKAYRQAECELWSEFYDGEFGK